MRVAIVGATGAVGVEFERVLAQRRFPATEYRLLASPRSAGRAVPWCGRERRIEALSAEALAGCDLAFFSAGASISREFAPVAAQAGALVIDNSSAFRMSPDVPLVVPEVNPESAAEHRGIIANPNCSTIILLVPLAPLARRWGARRVIVSTYQAVSGAGARALEELESQARDVLAGMPPQPAVLPEPCAFNVFSHNSAIGPDGFNVEETKMTLETAKILGDAAPVVTATCMRVPVMRAHLESVCVEFERPVDLDEARRVLAASPGVAVVDDRAAQRFPTSLGASGRDDVLVGRLRHDPTVPDGRGLHFICAGDQLRKGAALNAVQIAELVLGRQAAAPAAVQRGAR